MRVSSGFSGGRPAATGSSSYTETSIQTAIANESGNWLTGGYTLASTTTGTTTLTDSGSNADGSFSVSSTDTATDTRAETGNHLDGSYEASTGSTDSYAWTETTSGEQSFSLTATGSTSASGTETGNRVSGAYSTALSGSDTFTLVETGTATGGSYRQSLTGNETYSQVVSGNSVQQTVDVSDTGSGTYSMVDTGAGATSSGGSGSYGYTLTEIGSWHAGSVAESETGEDRYSLLQQFNNVADTSSGSGPGNLDYHPFGAAFVDPAPGGILIIEVPAYATRQEATKWIADNVVDRLGVEVKIIPLGDNRFGLTHEDEAAWETGQRKLDVFKGDSYTQGILEALVGHGKEMPWGHTPDRIVVAVTNGSPLIKPQPLAPEDNATVNRKYDASELIAAYARTGLFKGENQNRNIIEQIRIS